MSQHLGIPILIFASLVTVPALEAQVSTPTRLTNIINSYPDPSADGNRIVFQSNRTGRREIFVMDVDGENLVQLTNHPPYNETPVFSPDGSMIAFAAGSSGNTDIFIMNADGSGRKQLTDDPGDDSHPHWSTDGTRIIFNSSRDTPDRNANWSDQWHEVFSMNVDGGDIQKHTDCKAVCTYPSFSPDGTRIAYRKITNTPGFAWNLTSISRNSEVFVANVDGSTEINISNSAAFDGWPAWSPDGTKVAFTSNRMGPANVGHIFIVNADGTDVTQLTSGRWSYAQPAWSEDGQSIYAYQNEETDSYEFGDIAIIRVGH